MELKRRIRIRRMESKGRNRSDSGEGTAEGALRTPSRREGEEGNELVWTRCPCERECGTLSTHTVL